MVYGRNPCGFILVVTPTVKNSKKKEKKNISTHLLIIYLLINKINH